MFVILNVRVIFQLFYTYKVTFPTNERNGYDCTLKGFLLRILNVVYHGTLILEHTTEHSGC
jgi:hypothetical protein